MLAGWRDVFVSAVQGQVANLFLSLCQQLLAAARLQAPPGLSAAVVGSVRSTVESAAPFAAVQRRRTTTLGGGDGGGGGSSGSSGEAGGEAGVAPPPAALLLLCQLCKYAEREAVGLVLVLLQQLYPERLLAGGEELPAFQPTELGRQLAATAGALLQGYVAAHGAALADAAAASSRDTEWAAAGEPRAPRPVCDALLAKAAGERGGSMGSLGLVASLLVTDWKLRGEERTSVEMIAQACPSAHCPPCLPCAEVDAEAAYLLDPSPPRMGSRLSHMHSRAGSAASAASWESGLPQGPAHSHSSSRAGDVPGAYMEASVSRMLSARPDRWVL